MAEIERPDPFSFLQKMRSSDKRTTQAVKVGGARTNALQRRAGGAQRAAGSAGSNPNQYQQYARQRLAARGIGDDANYRALVQLWNKESGWNPNAVNKGSGAFGIAQILPSAHPDVPRNLSAQQQIDWGINYILGRYGSPSAAWSHSQRKNWY